MKSSHLEDRTWAEGGQDLAVGVLFSQSGPMAVTEVAHLKGTLLAIDEINAAGGINGRLLAPIVEEPASNPANYRDLARKLLAHDRVSVIFGCCSSASRKAVIPIVERYGALLFYPSFYEGFEYSPNVFYAGATPNQMVLPLANYLYRHAGKRFCLVGSDYIYPREINRIMKEYLAESGGTVTHEIYLAQGAGDGAFQEAAASIAQGKSDVILSTVVGSDTHRFYEACGVAGMLALGIPIASLTTSETELVGVSRQYREGHLTAAAYFQSLESPENREFIAKYGARYGDKDVPCIYSETSYFQVHLFAKAMATAANDTASSISKALLSLGLQSPQGEIRIDPETNHLYVRPRIGKSNADGLFGIVWEGDDLVKPDPYLVAYDRKIASGVRAGEGPAGSRGNAL